jgi:hypothetical protein
MAETAVHPSEPLAMAVTAGDELVMYYIQFFRQYIEVDYLFNMYDCNAGGKTGVVHRLF